MFLSYGTVAMFAFTILLNFFFLNSPVKSLETGTIYFACQDCLNDACHKDRNRPCMTRYDGTFLCFTCEIDYGNNQYYTFDECKTGCTNSTKICICTGMCFVCIAREFLENGGYLEECDLRTEQERTITCK
ncbi:uncharacterized protein LOC100570128 [Acyrthosiphon pisum]|uniref:ACYPI008667 protein n=1 Tax=Acyrthosiphon pisum TaxID=7029 RepID=A0A8R2H6D8_ACYPI|nr:uncharacterized protein LOC100570128 [Acyrthosiphon pisum]|eukprot:XP_016660028.1 PREDICTED: uncharacterized protein LOC100570128 [Acyrthosiphon pisum]